MSRPAQDGKGGAGPPSLFACFARFARREIVGIKEARHKDKLWNQQHPKRKIGYGSPSF